MNVDTYVALFYECQRDDEYLIVCAYDNVVEIEGEDEHSKVLVLFKGASLMQLPGRCKLCLKTKAHCQNTKSLG